jgi:hypothetical protein
MAKYGRNMQQVNFNFDFDSILNEGVTVNEVALKTK